MMNFLSSLAGKRTEARYDYNSLIYYRVKDRDVVWNFAHSLDVSARGLRIVINGRIENNTCLIVKMTLPGQETPLELIASVIWKKSLNSRSGVECGIEFDENACREDLERFRAFLFSKFGVALLQNA